MNKGSQTGLWAVRWFHANGYQAPYKVVEAENREDAVGMAQAIAEECVLSRFKCWSWKVTRLPYSKNENGKWFPTSVNSFFMKNDFYKER
jgi:hypothetical protein